MKTKYKKLTDLYVRGTECILDLDDNGEPIVMWLQIPNPFEMDDIRRNAQAARARMREALKLDEVEINALRDSYAVQSKESVVAGLVAGKYLEHYQRSIEAIEEDPEWSERMEVLRHSDEETDILIAPEREHLAALNAEWMQEVNKRSERAQEEAKATLSQLPDPMLFEEFERSFIENRANDRAMAEYYQWEILYAARVCEASPDEDGFFESSFHVKCDHSLRVWDSISEVREQPIDLITKIRESYLQIGMSVRDARFSARQGSLLESSPLPSEEAESIPSIPAEIS